MYAHLIENDPGVRGDRWGRSAEAEAAWRDAHAALRQVRDDGEFLTILRACLRAWRTGHLGIVDSAANVVPRATLPPRLTVLSPQTVLITLPSFEVACRGLIEALLVAHRAALESHPYWILDLRGNGGGADGSYEPLLDWLMPNDWSVAGTEFLATAANAAAHERLGRVPSLPADTVAMLSRLAASIRAASPGEYVRLDEERDGVIQRRAAQGFAHRPSRVGVLVDRGVASSCEQFLLEIRESSLVTLFGQPTAGILDYSNLRPWRLPSGRRTLWYATSRSLRLPLTPIDGIGVLPDVYLPPSSNAPEREAETRAVQQWLERHER